MPSVQATVPTTVLATVLAFIGALTGCAGKEIEERPERYASELSRFLKTRDEGIYARDERCLNLWRDYSVEVIDDEHLLFRRRKELWINKLRSRCPALRANISDTLAFDVSSGRMLCELDTVRQVRPGISGLSGGVPCPIGTFYQIAEPFVEPVLERR